MRRCTIGITYGKNTHRRDWAAVKFVLANLELDIKLPRCFPRRLDDDGNYDDNYDNDQSPSVTTVVFPVSRYDEHGKSAPPCGIFPVYENDHEAYRWRALGSIISLILLTARERVIISRNGFGGTRRVGPSVCLANLEFASLA